MRLGSLGQSEEARVGFVGKYSHRHVNQTQRATLLVGCRRVFICVVF